jgi:glycosyltransferase involved in cell wall biosynthesis
MRVCFINQPNEYYSPVSGGAIATTVMQLAKHLIGYRHDVTVLTPLNSDETYTVGTVVRIESPGRDELSMPLRKMAALRSRLVGWDWPYYSFYLNSYVSALKAMNPQPEVVILSNDLIAPPYVRAAVPNAKIITWLHNEQSTQQKHVDKAIAATDRFLTCSAYIRDYNMGKFGIPQDKITVCHSGVDLEAFSPAPDYMEPHSPLRALFIGRIDPNKGPDIAADAIAALQQEGLPITFTVAGGLWFYGHGNEMENPYFRTLKEKMDAANAEFLGYVTRPNVPELVRKHDVALVLSRSNEPFGLVTLEAMASGCAVISSNRGGLPESCGGGAILVNPDHLDAVIGALRTLASDPEALREQKQRGVARAQRGSWASSGDRLHHVLCALGGERPHDA